MKYLLGISLVLICTFVFSQKGNIDPSRIIDDLVGIQEEDADYESIYENLMQLLSHPADLNKITAEELRQLHLLTEQQINNFITHRTEAGELITLFELQSIPSFDSETIRKLIPFVKIREPDELINASLLKKIVKDGSHYLITRWDRTLEQKKGFSDDIDSAQRYIGTPDKYYLRFRSSIPGTYSFGFTAENDAAEALKFDPRRGKFGVDFLSVHAQLLNKGILKNLVVGDFQSQFGQGLIYGGAFGLGKGGETIATARRNNLGFLPHTSAAESGFFRGAGLTIEPIRNIFLSGMFSQTRRDATFGGDPITGFEIRSLSTSGFHRNKRETENEGVARERLLGGVIEYRRQNFASGIIVQHINYNFPLAKDTSVYNQFTFRGSENTNVGFHFSGSLNNLNIFGESALSLKAGYAIVAGVIASLDPKFDVAMVFRKFAKDYQPFYANPFSENTSPVNEIGMYWGWKYKWNRKYNIGGYIDLFKFPWLSFRRYKPSTGHEWLLRFNYQPSRKAAIFLQLREESKQRNTASEDFNYQLADGIKRNYWMSVSITASDNISLKSRVQYSTYSFDESKSQGMVISQAVSASVGKFQFSMNYALFDTEDFDNRQYVYENDVYLAFSLPAYDGTGVRNYFMIEYKFAKAVTMWVRYARTRFTDREEIGSGLETINGNTRNDVKFQTILKF